MYQRDVEMYIKRYLETQKILILVGARQVWKTTLLKKYYEIYKNNWLQSFFINLERPNYLELLNQDPENIFTIIGKDAWKKYIFIDEIQKLDDPTTFLKYLYDEYSSNNWDLKLIVTGSSAFYIDKKFKDSLAWRKHLLELYSLSFHEFLLFKGKQNFSQYIGEKIPLIVKTDIEQLAYEYMLYGWYPEVVKLKRNDDKKELLHELTNSYIKKDIADAWLEYENIYFQLLAILSEQIWELVNYNELANTLNVDQKTVKSYITTMRKSFHIAFISPYFKNKRKEITKMPKIYYYDLWIRNAMLNSFESIPLRLWDKWWILENYFFRTLLYKYSLDDIKFWRNNNKKEVDFVVDKNAWEVKYNIKKFSSSKYKVFESEYPNITLRGVDLWNILEEKVSELQTS